MQQPASEPVAHKPKRKKVHSILRGLSFAGGTAAIFLLGWGIGSNRISLQNGFQRSQQKDLPSSLDYSSVNEVYNTLKANYDGKLDASKLTDGLKEGLAKASGDPYTEYLNKQQYKDFDQELSGSFTGIGAELSKDKNSIVVVSPISGYPAEKAGLKPKDIIVEIDDKSTYDMNVSDAVTRIRGAKGTSVKLKIVRNSSEQLTFNIVRESINIPSVESKILDNNIGYLKISRFGDDTSKLARQAAEDFKQKNVKGVVLDLRGNPGGLLNSAVDVSSLWLQNKTVLSERRDGIIIRTFNSQGSSPLAGIPTSVLIDEGSASASEITAGALKDNGVATLVGAKSYGKGSVQQLAQLQGGGVLKVTIARWFTPAGKNIDKEGIQPDTKVTRSDDDIKAGRDPQKDAAISAVNK